jgi:hypothetical protein
MGGLKDLVEVLGFPPDFAPKTLGDSAGARSIEMSGYGDAETKKLRDNIENQLTRLLQQLQVCLHASRALSAGPKNIHGESGVDDGMKDRIARTAQ